MMTTNRMALKPIDGGNIKTLDAALYVVDDIVSNLSSGNLQSGVVYLNLVSLVNYLTNHGSAVEAMCREQLDRAFVRFRKSSLDGKLDFYIRRLMLYLIEMRANNWVATESVNRYYKTDEYFPMAGMTDNIGTNAGGVPALQSPTLPILAPGETIKSSGKYLAPTKIPGKNYFKDEVVIRNSDSGKVMGIKGRRVHMIEELSETVISFQRVNPGAKERLVQVTGPDEAHINYAQQLMGDTIRRNASPVPFRSDQADIERVGGSSSSVNSSASDESTRIQGYPRAKLHHSLSSNDATLDAYKYTVKPELSHVERPVSAFAAFRDPAPQPPPATAGRRYSRFALCMMAGADICKEPPADWEAVCPAALRKTGEPTRIIYEFDSALVLTPPPPIETTIAFRPKMFSRSKSEPIQDKSFVSAAISAAEASIQASKELPPKVAIDDDNDASVIFPSPLSLAKHEDELVPSLMSLRITGASGDFQTFPPSVSSAISPNFLYSPRAMSSPASNLGTPPLSPTDLIPTTALPREPEPAEPVVRTTIPFRPKLTNPKLNFGTKY